MLLPGLPKQEQPLNPSLRQTRALNLYGLKRPVRKRRKACCPWSSCVDKSWSLCSQGLPLRGHTHKADCLCQKRPRVSSSQRTVLAANLWGVFQFTALLPNWENKSSRNGWTPWEMVQTVCNIPCGDTSLPQPTTAVTLWPGEWIKTLITKAPAGSYRKTDCWKR